MLFTTLNGRATRDISITPYLIDWEHAVSKPQKAVKDFLRPYWRLDQVVEELRIPSSRYRVDLCNLSTSVMVEVSPAQHHGFNPFFHGSVSGWQASLKRDIKKERWAALNGLTYIELDDADLATLSVELFAERGVIL